MLACVYGQVTQLPSHLSSPKMQLMMNGKLPDGVELTLSELQDMASQQQQQIESQQQILVAKEQRLKFLKQQELRHQQMASDNERLRRLKEKAEAQELKLRKLRAQRGQVDQQKMSNTSLTSELESTRALFNEKEKELSVAAAKVEELSKQLEELRRGRLSNQVIAGQSLPAAIELEKLRRELLYRNKLNEQQNNKLAQQREALNRGQEEMNRIDRRIAELQQRLHRKRLLNQQLANQINAAASAKQAQLRASQTRNRVRPKSANIAAVEPFKHTPRESQPITPTIQPERSQDDLHPKLIVAKTEDLPEFQPNKNDPKYQTLPVNTKFSVKFNKNEVQQIEDVKNGNKSNEIQHATKKSDEKQVVIPTSSPSSNGQKPSTQTVHSIPAYAPPKGHATGIPQQNVSQTVVPPPPPPQPKQSLSNLAPKPFGSTYSSSLLSSTGPLASRSQPAVTVAPSTIGPVGSPPLPVPKYIPPPAPPANSAIPIYRPQTNLPSTPLTASATEKPTSSVPPTSLQQVKPSPPMGAPGTQNRPSTIYQTSSTRVTPITPHTFSTTSRGLLQEVEDPVSPQTTSEVPSSGVSSTITTTPAMTKFAITASVPVNARGAATEVYNGENSHNNSSVASNKLVEGPEISGGRIVSDGIGSPTKPSLPPKPSIPQKPTPPPRQIHANGDKTKVDTSQDAVDSALTILKSSAASKGNGSYRYAPWNVITDTYTQKLGSGALNQYLRNVTQLQLYGKGEEDLNSVQQTQNNSENNQNIGTGNDEPESEVNNKKVSQNDLPIKPKPLTIKKQSGVEPPKLKVLSNGNTIPSSPRKQSPPLENSTAASNANNNGNNGNTQNGNNRNNINVHISINRRIEMPPAFHFPENQSPPPDLNNTLNNGPCNELGNDESDNVVNIPPPPSHAPPPYPPLDVENKAWDPTKTRLDKSKRRPVTEIGVNDPAVLDNYNTNQLTDNEGNVESMTSFSPETEQIEEHSESNNSEAVIVNNQEQLTGTEDASLTNNSDSSGDIQSVETPGMVRRVCKGNLKTKGSTKSVRRVSFDPLALLLDASLEGELELVKKTANEVPNPSAANDEGITALHNAICAGHYEIVKFLVEFGCDVNAQDSDGWTPLHCAASCNNLPMVKFLVEHGACIFATTLSDCETAAQKCEEDEEGFDGCSEYLYSVQEKLGILNNGAVYALYDYEAQNSDELSFRDGEMIIVLRKGDEFEREWWWSQFKNREGYVPRNLLGLYPRVVPKKDQ